MQTGLPKAVWTLSWGMDDGEDLFTITKKGISLKCTVYAALYQKTGNPIKKWTEDLNIFPKKCLNKSYRWSKNT